MLDDVCGPNAIAAFHLDQVIEPGAYPFGEQQIGNQNEVAAVVSQPVIHDAYTPISDPAEEVALVGISRSLGDLEAGIRRIVAHHSAEFATAGSIRRKVEGMARIVMSKAGRLQIAGQIV